MKLNIKKIELSNIDDIINKTISNIEEWT